MSFDVQALPISGLKANTLDGYLDEIRASADRLIKKEDVRINGYPAVREVTVDTVDNHAQEDLYILGASCIYDVPDPQYAAGYTEQENSQEEEAILSTFTLLVSGKTQQSQE